MSSIRKGNENKVTPLRQLDRRSSNNDFAKMEETGSDYLLPSHSEISKKIANRLRVRRATGSQKRISALNQERANTTDKFEDLEHEPAEDFEHRLDFLWENNEEVGKAVANLSGVVEPRELRSKLLGERALLQCQLTTHELEEVVLARIVKLGSMARTAKRCQEQE
jgi:hypothetical protein